MALKHIIDELENIPAGKTEEVTDRRSALGWLGEKLALVALPLAIGSVLNKAAAQTTGSITDALNLILEIEFMQYTYIRQGTNTGGLIPAADLAGFKNIIAQDKLHIAFLEKLITEQGGVPFKPKYYTSPTTDHPYVPAAYDFTMGSKFTPFADYATFLAIAQVMKDTCIHALLGQVATFQATNNVLVQMLQLQAAEGRHAAYTRLRRRLGVNAPETPTPWIQNNIPPGPTSVFQKYYVGEDNVMQNGIDVQALGNTYYNGGAQTQTAATAAFDEPYNKETINTLIAPFKKL